MKAGQYRFFSDCRGCPGWTLSVGCGVGMPGTVARVHTGTRRCTVPAKYVKKVASP